MSKYNVAKGGKPLGKLTDEEIWRSLGKGELTADDLVWAAGWSGWKKISEVPELRVGIVESSTVSTLNQDEVGSSEDGQEDRVQGVGELEDDQSEDEGKSGLAPGSSSEEVMPAWERREELGVFQAFLWTVRDLFSSPKLTFSRMPVTGGFGGPLLLAFGIGFIAFLISMGLQMLLGPMLGGLGAMGAVSSPSGIPAPEVAMTFGMIIALLAASGVSLLIGPFIAAAIFHLCLKIVGGAHSGYEGTFRVYCYSYVVAGLLALIPCLGGILSPIGLFVWMIIGFSQVNSISVGRATLGVLLPLLVCCLCLFLAFALGVSQGGGSY